MASARFADPLRLPAQRGQMFLQVPEDAAIAAISSRIGSEGRGLVEIGVGGRRVNTTRALLETGWQGVWAKPTRVVARPSPTRSHLTSPSADWFWSRPLQRRKTSEASSSARLVGGRWICCRSTWTGTPRI